MLTAYLCKQIGVTPWQVIRETPSGSAYGVMDHAALHSVGLASNHGDIGLWLKKFGYTFSDYRYWVQAAMDEGVEATYVEATPVDDYPTLRKGDIGDDVREMQELLINLNYLPAGEDDGKFGSKTEAAVCEFQKDQGLTVDGVCGPKTWKRLREVNGFYDDDDDVQPNPVPDDNGYVKVSRADWNVLVDIINKYNSVG